MIRIEEAFEVARPIDEVAAAFADVPRVATCLPGLERLEPRGDGYAGTIAIRLGPFALRFEGEARIDAADDGRSGTIAGGGVDRRGGSRTRATIAYRLAPSDGSTSVSLDADVELTGPAAQFGRTGLFREVSRRIVAEFARCLEARLAEGTARAPDQAS